MAKITTIKLKEKTKDSLMQLKEKSESYDTVVSRLIVITKNKSLKQDLIECYSKNSKRDVKLLNEWETASSEVI